MTGLRRANLALVGLLGAHGVVHLARHPSGRRRVSPQMWIGAAALYASVATALALAVRRDRRAPAASAAAGLASFVAPLLTHATLGPLSDSYLEGEADALSWAFVCSA